MVSRLNDKFVTEKLI